MRCRAWPCARVTSWWYLAVDTSSHRRSDDFGAKKRKRRRSGVVYNSKAQRQVFRLPVPTPDVARRVEQLAAVAAAMQAKGIEYTDELRYSDAAPRSMNVAANELGGLQPMTKTNLELFRKFKTMTAQGLFAPMMVTNDPVQGYVTCRRTALVSACRHAAHA